MMERIPKRIKLLTSRTDGRLYGSELDIGSAIGADEALRMLAAAQCEVLEWEEVKAPEEQKVQTAMVEPGPLNEARNLRLRGRRAQ